MTVTVSAPPLSPAAPADRRAAIDNIYPLSPMQEGLLFHTLAAPEAGLYQPQFVLRLEGPLDPTALERAWRAALARHGVLRSSLHWEERDRPFQVVHRDVALTLVRLDWRDAGETEQAARHAALLAGNRAAPFDLRRPPLLRLHLADLGDGRHDLVVCHHHAILDGWSVGLLLADVFALYRHDLGLGASPPPPPRPYADYVGWLKRQDRAAATAFWTRRLNGLSIPVRLLPEARDEAGFDSRTWSAPPSLAAALERLRQTFGLTLATVLEGTLALLIAERTGADDVVFGATSAGRPADLDGATAMVGLFIGTLPVRIGLDRAQFIRHWLAAIQARRAEADAHAHLPLREIEAGHGRLFDCLLIVESFPVPAGLAEGLPLRIAGVSVDERTHYPLTVTASGQGADLRVTFRHMRAGVPPETIDALVAGFARLLAAMAAAPEAMLGTLVAAPRATPAIPPASPPPSALAAPVPRRAATTPTERLVAAAIAEVLKRPEPFATDHFFDLGGHSLLAARVVSRLRRDLVIDLPVKTLFDRPVLADLAAHIDSLREAARRLPEGHREIEI
ncbi:condensation domain-containing protein [Methylobrevis pamukkalensis]|uniref:Linear gramicidin synthase subunit D n=1 Tax=Methylobrevis pamukkalensis TaxID=1439726 RepID=A0A1E3H756_9HYPH|nr:condensation domain-containing protein [Methylobrevis pamukkalensis]ODN72163.1 Linear gramicidin synthase subunit D [Methylobrevis pamukkalensis]